MKKFNFSRVGNLCLVLAFGSAVSACGYLETPREEIPRDASRKWDLINGNAWYWGDKLDSGCTAWVASEGWVSVVLVTNPDCSADTRSSGVKGKRVTYFSPSDSDYSDQLEFREYGPWNSNILDSVNVFDSQGGHVSASAADQSGG